MQQRQRWARQWGSGGALSDELQRIQLVASTVHSARDFARELTVVLQHRSRIISSRRHYTQVSRFDVIADRVRVPRVITR